jgi:hypothetical protein
MKMTEIKRRNLKKDDLEGKGANGALAKTQKTPVYTNRRDAGLWTRQACANR